MATPENTDAPIVCGTAVIGSNTCRSWNPLPLLEKRASLFFEFLNLCKQYLNGHIQIVGKARQAVQPRYFSAEQFFIQPNRDFVEFSFAKAAFYSFCHLTTPYLVGCKTRVAKHSGVNYFHLLQHGFLHTFCGCQAVFVKLIFEIRSANQLIVGVWEE